MDIVTVRACLSVVVRQVIACGGPTLVPSWFVRLISAHDRTCVVSLTRLPNEPPVVHVPPPLPRCCALEPQAYACAVPVGE